MLKSSNLCIENTTVIFNHDLCHLPTRYNMWENLPHIDTLRGLDLLAELILTTALAAIVFLAILAVITHAWKSPQMGNNTTKP